MGDKKCILYHADWVNYARNFQVKDIPIEKVTDIAYAFFNLQDSGKGAWIITPGDSYPLHSPHGTTLTAVGQIFKILLLAKGLTLKIHGILHLLTSASSANSTSSGQAPTVHSN